MNKYQKLTILIISLCFVLFTGYLLRHNNYNKTPISGESVDEYSFAWLGLSLIQTGIPIATSGLNPYQHIWKYIDIDGFYHKYYSPNPFPIDQPWFDHPPLFGILIGGSAYLNGVRDFADANIEIIRKPMVIIGTLNIGLLFLLAYLIFGLKTAFVSSLIFSTEPLVVISSRMVQAENLLITFFLGALISLYLYFKKDQGVFFWLAISLSGLATLTKISGWSVALSLILLTLVLTNTKKYQKSLLIFSGAFIIFLFFPLMGAIYDWNLFLKVLLTNSTRLYAEGTNILYSLLIRQNITRDFGSGWVILGWISATILSLNISKSAKNLWIIIPLVSYLFVYLIFGSQSYGWYKFPFYPFLIIAVGQLFVEILTKPNLIFNIFLLLVPGGVMLDRFLPAEKFQNFIWFFRLFYLFGFSILFLTLISDKFYFKKAYQFFIICIFLGLVLLNIQTSLMADQAFWFKQNWVR